MGVVQLSNIIFGFLGYLFFIKGSKFQDVSDNIHNVGTFDMFIQSVLEILALIMLMSFIYFVSSFFKSTMTFVVALISHVLMAQVISPLSWGKFVPGTIIYQNISVRSTNFIGLIIYQIIGMILAIIIFSVLKIIKLNRLDPKF